ncbi:N-acetylglucosamine repressor [Lignipirellula cremea]|uniref:N-acetylglucosamine repressor n=2 Tax=Lignipirellula cremea TaxID=2528010 RepID=A0A518DTW8_9BACT|nr:N-acetylglucosamine repressor [Lignipirellula cremea]
MSLAPPEPKLLSNMNQRSVIRVLQQHGPCSRADVTRQLGVTAPTVSKAVASLLASRFVEEFECKDNAIGRPAKRLRLATQSSQVLGLVIDAEECHLTAAGLDGELRSDTACRFPTPKTYRGLLSRVVRQARRLMDQEPIKTLGLGISLPGLIDYRRQQGLLSPNVPITNGRSPAQDLSEQLGVECVLLQETHALCIAERHCGDTGSLEDFAMLDMGVGLGLGLVTGGQILTGSSGLAGEIGHIPYEPAGRLCGCGKRGCLETVASNSAVAWQVSQRLDRKLSIEEIIDRVQQGQLSLEDEWRRLLPALAFALATIINLLNPSTLFVNGRLFDLHDDLLNELRHAAQQTALQPAVTACRIVKARGNKQQGAVAGIIEHLADTLAPGVHGMLSRQS